MKKSSWRWSANRETEYICNDFDRLVCRVQQINELADEAIDIALNSPSDNREMLKLLTKIIKSAAGIAMFTHAVATDFSDAKRVGNDIPKAFSILEEKTRIVREQAILRADDHCINCPRRCHTKTLKETTKNA